MEIEQPSESQYQSQASVNVENNPLYPEFLKYTSVLLSKNSSKSIIENETKFHSKGCLMTLGLIEYEKTKIIDPILASSEVDNDVRSYLENKKKELDSLRKNLLNMFSTGKLNANSYLYAIEKMITANTKIYHDTSQLDLEADLARVKKRLDILGQEREKFRVKANQAQEKKSVGEADMSASGFFSKVEKLSAQELWKLLQIRIPQYWALANFLNEQVLPSLDSNEQIELKERLQNYFYPLVTRASEFQQQLQAGTKTPEITTFIRKEILDLNPSLLHGKSLEERQQDLQKLIEEVEECVREESDYISILKGTLDDPDQVSGPVRIKIKEAEKVIQKYQEYIEYLSKLGSQKFAWVPTPKIGINKEQRIVNLLNSDVPGNSLQVVFKRLNNIARGSYWIRWGIETHEGFRLFETGYCDSNLLAFDYKEMVEMTSKTRMDPTIEKKEITVEVLYKKLGFLMEKKEAYGSVPLSGFQNTNTLEGKVKLAESNAELYYSLKIRQPLMKSTRIEVKAVHTFKTFPIFNKEQVTSVVSNKPNISSQPSTAITSNQASIIQPKTTNQVEPSSTTLVNTQTKMQEEPTSQAGAGLLKKKTYPTLVLLKQDQDPLANLKQEEIPQGFTLEVVLNPSDPEKIESLTVLKTMSEVLEKARSELAGEGRKADNKFVSDNWTKSLRKAMIMQAKFEAGDIEPEEYLEQLVQALKRDKKLMEFYERKRDVERLAFIKEKINIIENEAKELMEGLQG